MQETSAALIDQLVYIDNFINNSDTPNLDVDGQLSLDLAAFADESFVFADEEKPQPDEDGDPHDDFLAKKEDDFQHVQGSLKNFDASFTNFAQNLNYHDDPLLRDSDLGRQRRPTSLNESTKAAKRNRMNQYGKRDADYAQDLVLPSSNVKQEAPPPPLLSSHIPDLLKLPKFPVPPGAKNSLQQAGLSQNQIDLLSALVAQHQTQMGLKEPAEEPVLYAVAPVLTSHSRPTLQSFLSGDLEHSAPVSLSTRGSVVAQSFVESPGSNYSSGYSSGPNSNLSTPVVSTRASFSTGSEGNVSVADLDKRRRNTAASARFRIKKKLKEKEMEGKIQQLNDLIEKFELKINELEMENRLLKNLIIEKGNRNSDEELQVLKEKAKYQNKQ